MNQPEKDRHHNRALCAAAAVWLGLAVVLPLYEVWAIVVTLFAMGVTYVLVKSRAMK